MKFEISKKFQTNLRSELIIEEFKTQLKKISASVINNLEVLEVIGIEASFGSINRYDKTLISVKIRNEHAICIADVTYRPSIPFWIFFIIGFCTGFFWIVIPLYFYINQKKTVKNAIEDVFNRVKDSCENIDPVKNSQSLPNAINDLEKLSQLKEKGVITEEEFNAKKRQLLNL